MSRFDKAAADTALLQLIAGSFNKPNTFSDITVICGSQSFLCHKLVLTHRSKWFEKALNGRFEESKSDIIELHDEDEQVVHAMLDFCYSLSYQHSYGSGYGRVPGSDADFHALVFAAGEKYFVQGLADLAADKFVASAKIASEDCLTEAIGTIYTSIPDPDKVLRKAVVDIVLEKASTLLNDEDSEFDKLFETLPGFGGDIARGLVKKTCSASPAPTPSAPQLFTFICGYANCRQQFKTTVPPTKRYTHYCPTCGAVTRCWEEWQSYRIW